jgi:hypothetical protein
LSDRIAVIYEGEIVGELTGDVSEEDCDTIGLMMTGQYHRPAEDGGSNGAEAAHDA